MIENLVTKTNLLAIEIVVMEKIFGNQKRWQSKFMSKVFLLPEVK
jgi:hypothetical protein